MESKITDVKRRVKLLMLNYVKRGVELLIDRLYRTRYENHEKHASNTVQTFDAVEDVESADYDFRRHTRRLDRRLFARRHMVEFVWRRRLVFKPGRRTILDQFVNILDTVQFYRTDFAAGNSGDGSKFSSVLHQ